MNTDHFKYLLEVVNCGSINKASSQLRIKQQRLSKIISLLEDEFGTEIFLRTSKGVTLTPQGKKIVDTIEPFISEINQLQNYFSSNKNSNSNVLQGELFIHKFPSITAEYYTKFTESIINKNPKVSVHLEESSFESTLKIVETMPLHVGIVLLFESQFASIPDNLEFIPVLNRFPVVYASSNSDFAKKYNSTSLKSLLEEPLVEYRPFTSSDCLLKQLFKNIGTPKVKYSVSNLRAFYDSLNQNKYISIGTSHLKILHKFSDINVIPIRDKVQIKQGLLVNKESITDPIIKMFIDSYRAFYKPFIVS
jgi:DNA-binding transcriptional LysR family regulator